jgi:DNA-binding CsgD family transcriptional regulator
MGHNDGGRGGRAQRRSSKSRVVSARLPRAPQTKRSPIQAALDALAFPAFVTNRAGETDHVNEVGRALLETMPDVARQAVVRAIEAFERGVRTGATVTPLATDVERWLVILRSEDIPLEERLRSVGTAWKLTERQSEVLHGIASGESNKTIAERLGCAEATVESHATAIFRKARVAGRTALVAKLLGRV